MSLESTAIISHRRPTSSVRFTLIAASNPWQRLQNMIVPGLATNANFGRNIPLEDSINLKRVVALHHSDRRELPMGHDPIRFSNERMAPVIGDYY